MEVEIRKSEKNYKNIILYTIFLIMLVYCSITIKHLICYILMLICGLLVIYNILAYRNKKIIFSSEGIKYINFLKKEYVDLWENIVYIKQKKQYYKSVGKTTFSTRYEIITEYILKMQNGKRIYLNEKEFLPAARNIFETAIRKNKTREEENIIDGENVKVLKTSPFSFLMYLFVSVFFTFLVLVIFIGLSSNFQTEVLCFCLAFVGFDIYFISNLLMELMQLVQKVYFVENHGFYKKILGSKKFYEFKDIDECKFKRYFAIQTIEYKAILYKDNKKILTITNSNKGFYDFIDEIRYKEIDKK